jgi:hypothetical protein
MRRIYFLGLLVFFVGMACHQETKQKRKPITVDLFVRYLQPERQYKAEAVVYEGDSLATAQTRSLPGGLIFMNQGLNARQLGENKLRHDITFIANYEANAAFRFRDDDKLDHVVAINMSPIIDFKVASPAKLNGILSIQLEDQLLGQKEALVVLLTDSHNQSYSVTLQGPAVSKNFDVPLSAFGVVNPGKADLYLVKKQIQNDLSKDRLRIHTLAEFYTKSIAIELVRQ